MGFQLLAGSEVTIVASKSSGRKVLMHGHPSEWRVKLFVLVQFGPSGEAFEIDSYKRVGLQ